LVFSWEWLLILLLLLALKPVTLVEVARRVRDADAPPMPAAA
jgi:hypothetical protein